MSKIVFPNITIIPSNQSEGWLPTTKPRVRIPHIVGTGTNGIPLYSSAKPVVTGANSIVSATGNLTDANNLNGKVWRLRLAADINGNVAPGTPVLATTITDVTPTNVFPTPSYTEVQFAPTGFSTSKFYKMEIEEELEYVLYSTASTGGDQS